MRDGLALRTFQSIRISILRCTMTLRLEPLGLHHRIGSSSRHQQQGFLPHVDSLFSQLSQLTRPCLWLPILNKDIFWTALLLPHITWKTRNG